MSSFKYNNVFIKDYKTIAGPKEKEGYIQFNECIKDYYNEEKTIEDAEIKMQEYVLNKLMINNKLTPEKIGLIILIIGVFIGIISFLILLGLLSINLLLPVTEREFKVEYKSVKEMQNVKPIQCHNGQVLLGTSYAIATLKTTMH